MVFPLFIHSSILASSRHRFEEPVCHGWLWIFKTSIYRGHHSWTFFNLVLFWVLLRVIPSVFQPQGFLWVLQSFLHVIYPFSLSMFFLFLHLLQNCFASSAFSCWFILRHSPPNCLVENFSVILESSVLFVLLDTVLVSFKSSFFQQYHLIYLFKMNYHSFRCFVLVFSSQHIPVCFSFLSIFTCHRFCISIRAP